MSDTTYDTDRRAWQQALGYTDEIILEQLHEAIRGNHWPDLTAAQCRRLIELLENEE